jgi:hypothetical protein
LLDREAKLCAVADFASETLAFSGLWAKPSDGFAEARLTSEYAPKQEWMRSGTWVVTALSVVQAG